MTRKVFAPREYQTPIIDHIHEIDRCGVFASMGSGKTVATATALESLYHFGVESMPTLVLAPFRVAQSTWPDEFEKWQHLRGMEVVPILGTAAQRITALNRDAPIFTMNYENIPWLIDWFKHNPKNWPFGTVVADESTKLKSTRVATRTKKDGTDSESKSGGGARGRALTEVAHKKVHRWIDLTGSPAPNGLKDLWGQVWYLDGGKRLGRSFNAFEQRWFDKPRGPTGYQSIQPKAHAQDEIQALLKDICLTIDVKDYLDISEPITRNVEVELPGSVRAMYRKFEREMFMQIGEHEIEAFNAASRTMKCLQLANGAVYTDDEGNWKEVHDVKIQALEEIIEEAAGMPVLVAYNFKSDLARLGRAFPKARVLDSNPQTIRDWNAGKIPILFTHPASAGHGLNLQDGGNILVFFSVNWDLEQHQQIIERIGPTRQKQAGRDRAVFVYRIVARGTVDDLVLERLNTKAEVQTILLNAMKRMR